MPSLSFTVDAALFRELGERLVGRPHIALAELIKNSYDADATQVTLRFDRESIEISDNGNGMTFEQFRNFWMRIGSPHKQSQQHSPRLKRPLTGSKGIGRLSVQFLGSRIDVTTVSIDNPTTEISAHVDWERAVSAGEITNAQAEYSEQPATFEFPGSKAHGTSILLRGLRHAWLPGLIADVAREIWALEPPFRPNPRLEGLEREAFYVTVETADDTASHAFHDQMRAYLNIWYARLVGRIVARDGDVSTVALSVEFADGKIERREYHVANADIHSAEFEIRVYYLTNRQGRGIRVEEARQYLNRFGGVHIYDGGFHLPYYGPDTDWLDVDRDHAKRLSISQLLPKELQVERGLNYLPSQSRLFGVVHVDTAFEREAATGQSDAREILTIQLSRDRLVENAALESLRRVVRWSLDFFAMLEAKRALDAAERTRPTDADESGGAVRRTDVLARYKADIPNTVYSRLAKDLRQVDETAQSERDVLARRTGLMAALATAGIAALGFDHELGKQLRRLDDFVGDINELQKSGKPTAKALERLNGALKDWIKRAQSTRALFGHLSEEENRTLEQRLNARAVIHQTKIQLGALLRGVEIDLQEVDPQLLLPTATFAEWSALFQNAFLNAVNAMMDSQIRRIVVRTKVSGNRRAVVVEDTGSGVKLVDAERLFQPFERGLAIKRERKGLGLGGTGMGLPIVRMIATNRRATVTFIQPRPTFSTALQLEWREL